MAAQEVGNPNLQGQNLGGGVSQPTFGALGKRKLQQAFFANNPTGVITASMGPCALNSSRPAQFAGISAVAHL